MIFIAKEPVKAIRPELTKTDKNEIISRIIYQVPISIKREKVKTNIDTLQL